MKQFKKNVLVVTLSMLSSAALHAQSNTTTEIEQLRNGINALKQNASTEYSATTAASCSIERC